MMWPFLFFLIWVTTLSAYTLKKVLCDKIEDHDKEVERNLTNISHDLIHLDASIKKIHLILEKKNSQLTSNKNNHEIESDYEILPQENVP